MKAESMSPLSRIGKPLAQALLISAIVFFASLFGILTRPLGFLAAFWPTNALLLGIVARWPQLASLAGWSGAVIGYFAADMVTGESWLVTSWLTAGNLAGVITGFLLFRRCRRAVLQLESPHSVLWLFTICTASSLMAAVVGSGSAPLLFGKSWTEAFTFWFATELVNSIIVLPVVFTAPSFSGSGVSNLRAGFKKWRWKRIPPFLGLLGSVFAAQYVAGPGAIAFPIPALVWCALSYGLFRSVLLTLLLCMWLMIAISAGFLYVPLDDDFMYSMTSLRLGIALLALGPLTVASINQVTNDLLDKLHDIADHDDLTRTLSRKAFFERGSELFLQSDKGRSPVSVMMLDIDDFKKINDQHGHAAGDRSLCSFASRVSSVLREVDLLGRLGGEEFGVILPGTSAEDADAVAARLHREVQGMTIVLENGSTVQMTVSVGLATKSILSSDSLETIVSLADDALYKAKKNGRAQSFRNAPGSS